MKKWGKILLLVRGWVVVSQRLVRDARLKLVKQCHMNQLMWCSLSHG